MRLVHRTVALALLALAVSLAVPARAQDEPGSSLSVAEYALGTGVENRVLQGKAERFPEGGSVYLWTKVLGGSDGDRIRHVWIHEGKEVTVGLSIGGPSWRTWSSKALRPGSIGDWAVEVRDADGKVLARAEFECYDPSAG